MLYSEQAVFWLFPADSESGHMVEQKEDRATLSKGGNDLRHCHMRDRDARRYSWTAPRTPAFSAADLTNPNAISMSLAQVGNPWEPMCRNSGCGRSYSTS
jgi:hypothetical protein